MSVKVSFADRHYYVRPSKELSQRAVFGFVGDGMTPEPMGGQATITSTTAKGCLDDCY